MKRRILALALMVAMALCALVAHAETTVDFFDDAFIQAMYALSAQDDQRNAYGFDMISGDEYGCIWQVGGAMYNLGNDPAADEPTLNIVTLFCRDENPLLFYGFTRNMIEREQIEGVTDYLIYKTDPADLEHSEAVYLDAETFNKLAATFAASPTLETFEALLKEAKAGK